MTVICVDLSHYQKGFDFHAFKAGGGLGVICKATEGSTITDSCYAAFKSQARDAGLAFASYHFMRKGDQAAQIKRFLGVVEPVPGERVCLDFEDDSLTLNDLINAVEAIMRYEPLSEITVYSGHTIKEKLGDQRNAVLDENTSLWIAQYTSATTPSWPTATWPQWSLWQYSDTGHVHGFAGDVDCNRFNGSNSNFLKWMGPKKHAAPVEDAPEVAITVRGTVNLTVNGVKIEV
jgi:lysozyme